MVVDEQGEEGRLVDCGITIVRNCHGLEGSRGEGASERGSLAL